MVLLLPTPSTLGGILVRQIRNRLSSPSFLSVHRLYFLAIIFVSSIIFWLLPQHHQSVPFIDSLFLVVSAITSTGLTTRNLSTLNTAQQILIWILIVVGSPTFISVFVVWVRRRAFESKFANVIFGKRQSPGSNTPNEPTNGRNFNQSSSDIDDPCATTLANSPSEMGQTTSQDPKIEEKRGNDDENGAQKSSFTAQTCVVSNTPNLHSNTPTLLGKYSKTSFLESVRVFGNAMVGRNSQFYGLTRDEREQLGCIEYKALKLLSILVPAYLISFQVIGSIAFGSFISARQADVAYQNGVEPWWLGVFHGVSAFNNAGMSLLDANMIPFQSSYYILLTTAFLTLAGNTAYPIFLRLLLWLMHRIIPKSGRLEEWADTMAFILKYPRRVYTHLFPSTATWYLLLVLFVLNGIDFISFEVLNHNNPVFQSLPPTIRNLDGLVQTIFIRSAGFTVISISSLRIGLQALYVPMMFISAFPVAITMRSSNVYEERSLGIYASQLQRSQTPQAPENGSLLTRASRTRLYFLRQQLSHQLSHDFWFVVICAIAIIWIETGSYDRDPFTFSVFNILFEVISAYSCVGLSVGLPDQAYSLSGKFHTTSKLILCFLMFRGRHRDLPVAIDRAVQLPSSVVGGGEEEETGESRSVGVQGT
ncbi:hypothetical protein HYFRA_00008941 [Hymenoscyphus fraxineus]|uniref:Potassium transport protein n=1 Tax=Hymenoscyphus fraxineus TaxID=746836 RepID=A0A9N9KTL3_9HELO|nr:hypothetical protein HYFRA_00008941 [Hymenoscyphus fraxineus]